MQKVQNDPLWTTKYLKGGHFFLIKDDFFEDVYFDKNMHKFLGPNSTKGPFLPHKWDTFGADSM